MRKLNPQNVYDTKKYLKTKIKSHIKKPNRRLRFGVEGHSPRGFWILCAVTKYRRNSMLDGMAKTHGERGDSSLPNGSGLLDYAEDMLGGLWKGLMDAKVQVEAMMESSGLNGLIDRVRGFTEEYMNTPGDYIQGKGEYFGSTVVNGVRNVWDGIKGFGERTGNLVTEGEFASDEEVAEIQARQRIQEAIKNGSALEEGSEEYNRVMAALNGKPAPKVGNSGTVDLSQSEEIRKLKEIDRALNGGGMSGCANSKAVEDIMAKIRDGKTVDASDLENLTKTMLQKSTLPKEVLDSILNDKDAFQQLAGKTFDFGENGTVKLDFNDPESIKVYAENISKVYCVTASLYGQMVVNGIGGTPSSFGEFTKKLLEKGLVDPSKPARQIESTQNIIDAFAGKGNYQVVGYGVDAGGGYFNDEFGNSTKGYGGEAILNKLFETANDNSKVDFFNVRINSPHNMNLYNNDGDLRLYDTSKRGFDVSLGENKQLIKPSNIKSWYYVRPARRR